MGKLRLPERQWDQVFAPSSHLAIITTVDEDGRINAGTYGTCTRVLHSPVYISFATNTDGDTAHNVAKTGQFTVNLPSFDRSLLEKCIVTGLRFDRGIDELAKAGLTAGKANKVAPPLVMECNRHFECAVAWTHQWEANRTMVCGKVLDVSADEDVLDEDGLLRWDVARPVHFCGAPYGTNFVAMDQVMPVESPYSGPEVDRMHAEVDAMFRHL